MSDFKALQEMFGDLEPFRNPPEFWIPTPELARGLIDSLTAATVRTIGRSAGGRPIPIIEYGEKEPLQTQTDNLQSAVASKVVPPDPTAIFPAAFYGANRRRRPVVFR